VLQSTALLIEKTVGDPEKDPRVASKNQEAEKTDGLTRI
jgi:hypothetical protein